MTRQAWAAGLLHAGVTLAAVTHAADSAQPTTASGKFEDKNRKLALAGAYAYRDKTSGFGEDQVIRVAVSNAEFNAKAVDDH